MLRVSQSRLAGILRLELQKQKKIFFSSVAIIALGVGGAAFIVPSVRSLSRAEAFSGASAFLIYLMPLIAVTFAVSSSVLLRRSLERSCEELIPVHPVLKVFGAYAISLALFFAIGLPSLSLLGSIEVYDPFEASLGMFFISVELLVLELLFLHAIAFVSTYLLSLPVLGGGLALIIWAVDLFFRSVLVEAMHGRLSRDISVEIPPYPSGLVLSIYIFLVLRVLFSSARRIERGMPVGWTRGTFWTACLLAGPLFTIGTVVILGFIADRELAKEGLTFWQLFWGYRASY